MNIKGFKIKKQKVQKIWIAIFLAVIIAIVLIITAFFLVFKQNKSSDNKDLFDFKSYYTNYNIVTYSNKNQNIYMMEEYCMRENDKLRFRFNTINDTANYSYIVTPDSFSIKSDDQINELNNYNYIQENTNVLSLATFIDVYLAISNRIEGNTFNSSGTKIEVEQKNNTVSYSIIFENKKLSKDDSLYKYNNILVNGMKISKLELVLNFNSKLPMEYIVYLDSGNAYVDITYNEFKINPKFDEKVFSF